MAFLLPLAAVAMAGGAVYSAVQQKRAADAQEDAARQAAEAQKQAQERQKELQAKQEEMQAEQERVLAAEKEEAQKKSMEMSDQIRRKRTVRGRRSLLSGDELGVTGTGARGVTG